MAEKDDKKTSTHRTSGSAGSAVGPARRPGLAIVGMSVADIVGSVGGWSVDCALAGWQVDAYLPVGENARALQIIGATPAPLDALLGSRTRPDGVTSIVVSVAVFHQHPELWERVMGWFPRHLTELAVWGDLLPLNMIERLHSVERPISNAAAAFKAFALQAAGSATPVARTESFSSRWNHRVGNTRPRARLG